MNETVLQENGTETTNQEETRTFTQAEVDAIVTDRLSRQKSKYSDYEALKEKATKYDEYVDASKSELQRATEKADALQSQLDALTHQMEVTSIRSQIANEMKVPASLLTGTTLEECEAQAKAILDFAKPKYPSVKDGGEVNVTHKKTEAEQFAEWFDKVTN